MASGKESCFGGDVPTQFVHAYWSPCIYVGFELDDNKEQNRIVRQSHQVNDMGPDCFNQSFQRNVFKVEVAGNDETFTNITGIVVKCGSGKVYVADGDPINMKIMYSGDILLNKWEFAGDKFIEVR